MSSHDTLLEAMRLQFRGLKQAEILEVLGQFAAENTADAEVQGAKPPTPGAVFPEGRSGNVGTANGLYRINYFNGRFLTADDLRAEQVYWDLRARMDAEVHPSGIAWGLTLDTPTATASKGKRERIGPLCPKFQANVQLTAAEQKAATELFGSVAVARRSCNQGELCKAMEVAENRNRLEEALREIGLTRAQYTLLCKERIVGGTTTVQERWVLHPGLAFDGIGRPVSVGAKFPFDVTDLIRKYRTRPTTLVTGGTQFAPCICIDSSPPARNEPGAALGPGAYLLVILPTEDGEGKARVYGTACSSGRSTDACEVDGWRGGFELLLVRVPVTLPRAAEPQAFRGLLSAWYFDVHEHNLTRRWERERASSGPFPLDAALWQGPGPDRLYRSAVPLAMVFLGADSSVEWVDSWIPRRPIASTGASAWAANVRGSPTASARIARQHQFQQQLIDSLAEDRHPLLGGSNLFQRGFRHLPPWGFLPTRERLSIYNLEDVLSNARRLMLDSGGEEPVTATSVFAAAAAFFKGTNVLPLYAFALHEDEIFEDIARADDKDPILLQEGSFSEDAQGSAGLLTRAAPTPFGGALTWLLAAAGNPEIWRLIARRQIEVVRIVALLDEGVRVHPELAGMEEVAEARGSASSTFAINRINARATSTRQPGVRPWAFYVKERVEFAGWLVGLLAILARAMVAMFQRRAAAELNVVEAADLSHRRMYLTDIRPATHNLSELHVVGAALVAAPGGAEASARELLEASPGLGSRAFWAAYDTRLAAEMGRHASPVEARDAALDALAIGWPAAEDLKLFALILPDSTFGELRAALVRGATHDDVPLSARAFAPPGDRTLTLTALAAADQARAELAALPLTDLVKGVDEALTVGDVLDLSDAELEKRLTKSKARLVIDEVAKLGKVVLGATVDLAEHAAGDDKVAVVVAEARTSGRELSDVVGRLKVVRDREGDGVHAAEAVGILNAKLSEGAALRILTGLRLPEKA